MTQKELSYLEDAIGHEDNIIKICRESINSIEDENLVSFINDEIDKHLTIKDKMINMLEVIGNE
ncbi:MAG: hypothetical protein IJF92_05845 [Bacilli bacterium]|nr:hypothetical protein [Bacilli bacterium]